MRLCTLVELLWLFVTFPYLYSVLVPYKLKLLHSEEYNNCPTRSCIHTSQPQIAQHLVSMWLTDTPSWAIGFS